MAIKRFCDRCGREISSDELSMVISDYIPVITSYLRIEKDICAKCMTEFVSFWERDHLGVLSNVNQNS